MIIHISHNKVKILLWFPLFFLRSKWIWRIVLSKNENIQVKDLSQLLPTLYQGIRKYIRRNGHFSLITFEDKDGSKISIRV